MKDVVDVASGPLQGKWGTVEYIVRGFLFLQCRDVQDHGGFACVQARFCKVCMCGAGACLPGGLPGGRGPVPGCWEGVFKMSFSLAVKGDTTGAVGHTCICLSP